MPGNRRPVSAARRPAAAAEPYLGQGRQEPLHTSIRHTYERVRRHMEGPDMPAGWPEMPPPAMSGLADCAIQYVDMSDSTNLSLHMDPVRYAALVTAFCRETALIVRLHGGHPLKFVGDAVVSIFTGYSLHAADSALGSAVSTMRMVHHALRPASGMRISVHVGMTYGRVVAVRQGGGLDVLGAPVNLAAKLLSLRRPVVMNGAFRERLHPESGDISEMPNADWPYGGTIHEYTGGFHD